jgi:MFS family permease
MVTSIYNISSGCLILLWGRLADVYGHRFIYLSSSAGFAIASISIPFSSNEIGFYALRALQGMSGAATVSSAVGILALRFPVGKSRNKAFVTLSAAASLGSILGNIAGGVIGGFLSWKWVFWIPSIPAVFVTIMAGALIPTPDSPVQDTQDSTKPFVDWVGAAMVSSGLLLILVALAEANVVGWTTPWILALIVISVILLAVFIFWQYHLEADRIRQPLMKISMFRNLQFSAIFVIICCFYGAFNSFLIFTTIL